MLTFHHKLIIILFILSIEIFDLSGFSTENFEIFARSNLAKNVKFSTCPYSVNFGNFTLFPNIPILTSNTGLINYTFPGISTESCSVSPNITIITDSDVNITFNQIMENMITILASKSIIISRFTNYTLECKEFKFRTDLCINNSLFFEYYFNGNRFILPLEGINASFPNFQKNK